MYKEKIIFVIQRVGLGGAELFFKTIVNSFKERGVEPVVIMLSADNPILDQLDPEIKTIAVPRSFRYDLSVSKRIKKIILEEKAKKVFCIGAFAFFLSKLLFVRNAGITFYLSLHTTVPFSLKNHLLDMLYLKFLGKQDATIFICKNQMEYYKEKYRFASKRSFVIYNGIDTQHFSPDSFKHELNGEVVRLLHNIPSDARVILNVANIRPEKGHKYAVEALHVLHKQHRNKAHLVFVGEASQERRADLDRLIAMYGLGDYVHFAGIQQDVRPYLAAADLFTLTSYSETFSLAALEAMSFGLPCVLTDTGGAAEMIVERKTGLLCKAKDAFSIAGSWHAMLEEKVDKRFIKQFAAENFSSEHMVERYLEVLSA